MLPKPITKPPFKQMDYVKHITFSDKDSFTNAVQSTFQVNECYFIKYNQSEFIVFIVNGYKRKSYQTIQSQIQSFAVYQKETPMMILNKDSLNDNLFQYLSLPINSIVSQTYFLNNFDFIIRNFSAYKLFFEPDFQRKLAIHNEKMKQRDSEISKIRLNGKKIESLFTPTEQRIIQLMLDGLSNLEIAGSLYFAPSTVARNISEIFKKLGVNDRTGAVVKIIRNGWVITD